MSYEEFLKNIETLSLSQGYYGRLLRQLEDLDDEELEKVKTKIESQHFNDMLDIVMYFES